MRIRVRVTAPVESMGCARQASRVAIRTGAEPKVGQPPENRQDRNGRTTHRGGVVHRLCGGANPKAPAQTMNNAGQAIQWLRGTSNLGTSSKRPHNLNEVASNRFIARPEVHHQRKTFQDGLQEFLRKHELEFDAEPEIRSEIQMFFSCLTPPGDELKSNRWLPPTAPSHFFQTE